MDRQNISCGIVVHTMIDREIHYILIKNKPHNHFGFPKGHMMTGESYQETALREVLEETGLTPLLDQHFKTETSYLLDSGKMKTVIYFLGTVQDPIVTIQEEEDISDYKIVPFDTASELLVHEQSKNVLNLVNQYLQLNI